MTFRKGIAYINFHTKPAFVRIFTQRFSNVQCSTALSKDSSCDRGDLRYTDLQRLHLFVSVSLLHVVSSGLYIKLSQTLPASSKPLLEADLES